MKKLTFFLLVISFFSCKKTKDLVNLKDDGKIEIVLLQINDVYEIAPLPGDDLGGLARVATLKKQLLSKNQNTLSVIAGDFFNPSVIGTLDDDEGNGIKGKHIVEVLNASNLDLATFGNHEFDLKYKDVQKRLNESTFEWVSSNVEQVSGDIVKPFYKIRNGKKQYIPKTIIRTMTDQDGTQIKVGFYGVTLDVKKQAYLKYHDVFKTAIATTATLEAEGVDLIIPITHLDVVDDKKLAEVIPNKFPLIIGGHDHHHMEEKVGTSIIAKADANAKTAYVHKIIFDKKTKQSKLTSELVTINNSIPSDSIVQKVVEKWQTIANNDLLKKGFQPNNVVTVLKEDLDGREYTVRGGQCELGKIVTHAMSAVAQQKHDVVITNSGSIRVDDILSGKLTEYDIIRILPYSGEIWEVEMTGTLLKEILETSVASKTKGAYLQWRGIDFDTPSKNFRIQEELLDINKIYTVVLNDFMLAGYDYKFLTQKTEGIIKIHKPDTNSPDDLRHDIRKAVINYLKKD